MLRYLRQFLLMAAAALTAHAQQTYTAKRIVFKNPGPFTQKQLEQACGMHAGSPTNATTMNAAAQRLVDSGYFDDIGVVLDGKADDVSVIFTLKPTDRAQMLHTGFENFVWLTHDELEAAILAKVPLFIDYLPENSPQADVITATLTQALAAKNIQAEVAHDTVEPTLIYPERVVEFRVVKPGVRVANVKLTGVTTDLVPFIQKSVNATAHTAYNEGIAGESTAERILAPLRDAGYIDAALSNVTLSPSPAADGGVGVVLSAALQAGDIYRVSHIGFAGAPLVTVDAFSATQKLHDGDIASRKLLLETLGPLDAAYRRQGYMDVVVNASPVLDKTQHQVTYSITITPGEQYRIHEVTANNLDPAARQDFDRGFLMKAGTLYNPEYVANFLKNNTALRALEGYNAAFKAYADPNTHTVDLVMTFVRGAAR